jgi:hypothetical protein
MFALRLQLLNSEAVCTGVQGSIAEDICVVLDLYQTWCIVSAPGWLVESANGAFAQSCIPNQHGNTLNLQQAIFRYITAPFSINNSVL